MQNLEEKLDEQIIRLAEDLFSKLKEFIIELFQSRLVVLTTVFFVLYFRKLVYGI